MASMTHKQIVNRLKDIQDEMVRLSEKENLTTEDEQYWAEIRTEFDELDRDRKELERQADLQRILEAAKNPRQVEHGSATDEVDAGLPDDPSKSRFKDPWDVSEMRAGLGPIQRANEIRSRALTAIEKMPAATDRSREVMTQFIERWDTKRGDISGLALATSNEAYVRAFGKLLGANGNMSVLEHDEQQAVARAEEFRAMSLTDSAGGFLVPFQLDPAVINTAAGSFNQVRQAARKVIATGDVWNGVSSAGVTGSWDAEGAEVSDDAPTLAQPTITVHKLAIFVPISIEALMDAQNVAQEVAEMIAFEKDRLESVAFVTGSGSGQPFGIVTALDGTSSEISPTTADLFGLVDVYKLDETLPARHRFRASWLAHRAIYNDVRQFDTSGGAALWERLGADVPPLLLGRPAFEAEAMASATSGTDTSYLVFGDFNAYVIADRIGTTVEFIPHLFHTTTNRPSGQRGWYAYARVGADSVDDAAFRMLTSD